MYRKFVTTAGLDFMNEVEFEYLEEGNWNYIILRRLRNI